MQFSLWAAYPLLSLRYKSCVTKNVTDCGKSPQPRPQPRPLVPLFSLKGKALGTRLKSPDKRSCLRERCKSHTTTLLSSRQRRRIKRHLPQISRCVVCVVATCDALLPYLLRLSLVIKITNNRISKFPWKKGKVSGNSRISPACTRVKTKHDF